MRLALICRHQLMVSLTDAIIGSTRDLPYACEHEVRPCSQLCLPCLLCSRLSCRTVDASVARRSTVRVRSGRRPIRTSDRYAIRVIRLITWPSRQYSTLLLEYYYCCTAACRAYPYTLSSRFTRARRRDATSGRTPAAGAAASAHHEALLPPVLASSSMSCVRRSSLKCVRASSLKWNPSL